MIVPLFNSTDATVDKFNTISVVEKGGITISFDRSLYVPAAPLIGKVTIWASNIDGVTTTNFVKFSADTNDVNVDKIIDIPYFGFAFLGISYATNSSTGDLQAIANTAYKP